MSRIICLVVLSFALVGWSYGQDEVKKEVNKEAKMSMHGYVVDAMCAKGMAKKDNPMEKAAQHTKECALEEGCASSGFGLFSEGKWYKFDEAGDTMTKELIEKSKTEKGMMVEVSGDMKDGKLVVASIEEQMMEKELKGKVMEKEEDEDEEDADEEND